MQKWKMKCVKKIVIHFLVIKIRMNFWGIYLAAPQPTLGHHREDSLTQPMLITTFYRQFSIRRSPGAS